jgi:hypothetical protein
VTRPVTGEHKIPVGPLVAVIGAVILIVSVFLDWYESVTGWTVFEIADLVLVGLSLWTIYVLAGGLGLGDATFNPTAALIAAVVTLVIVLTQITNDPPAVAGRGADKELGIWLALAGAGLMVAGALLATTRISLAVEARPRGREPAARDADTRTDATREESTVPLTRPRPPEPPPGGSERT